MVFYTVTFKSPINKKTSFNFDKIAAIYKVFTPKQIGVSKEYLYVVKSKQGFPFYGSLCTITAHQLITNKNFNMKKQVSDFVKALGYSTAYSGNDRTMYVKGFSAPRGAVAKHILEKITNQFPSIPFTIKIN